MKHQSDSSTTSRSDSHEPEIPELFRPEDSGDGVQSEDVAPKDLSDAETQLRVVAARYNQSGEEQFAVLKEICFLIFSLKQFFDRTPLKHRPSDTRTWAKYAPAVAKRCGLRFASDRMADNYARLYLDMKTVGPTEIQKRVSDGSFRAVRKAANELLKTPDGKPDHGDTAKLLRQAARLVRKAMEAEAAYGHLRSLVQIQESLSKAARAERKRDDDVVPELAQLGIPDRERRRINYAVRADDVDPVAAGDRSLGQCVFDYTPLEVGAFVLPAWSRPEDVALPLTDAGRTKWIGNWQGKRRVLISALVRRYGFRLKTLRPQTQLGPEKEQEMVGVR